MNWTPDERDTAHRRAEAVFIGVSTWDADVRADCAARGVTEDLRHVSEAMLDYAAELLAARSGTMTAEELIRLLQPGILSPAEAKAIARHFAALGGKVAALEARLELERNATKAEMAILGERHDKWKSEAQQARRENEQLRAELAWLKPKPVRHMWACKACGKACQDAVPCPDHPMMPVVSLHPSPETLIAWLDHEQQEARALHTALRAANARWQKAEADPKPSGQVAEKLKANRTLHEALDDLGVVVVLKDDSWHLKACRAPREECSAECIAVRPSLQYLAALAQQGQEATDITGAAITAAAELRHAFRPETRDWNLVSKAICILEEATTPGKPTAQPVDNAPWRCAAGTCGHNDRHNPGHAAQVAERSQAFNEAAAMHPNGHCTCAGEGFCHWCGEQARAQDAYDRGAEAMRAACWVAVQPLLQRLGLSVGGVLTPMGHEFKAAIDGAAP